MGWTPVSGAAASPSTDCSISNPRDIAASSADAPGAVYTPGCCVAPDANSLKKVEHSAGLESRSGLCGRRWPSRQIYSGSPSMVIESPTARLDPPVRLDRRLPARSRPAPSPLTAGRSASSNAAALPAGPGRARSLGWKAWLSTRSLWTSSPSRDILPSGTTPRPA